MVEFGCRELGDTFATFTPAQDGTHLNQWFERVSDRDSYKRALLDWEADGVADKFKAYTMSRREAGTDVRSFPHFSEPK